MLKICCDGVMAGNTSFPKVGAFHHFTAPLVCLFGEVVYFWNYQLHSFKHRCNIVLQSGRRDLFARSLGGKSVLGLVCIGDYGFMRGRGLQGEDYYSAFCHQFDWSHRPRMDSVKGHRTYISSGVFHRSPNKCQQRNFTFHARLPLHASVRPSQRPHIPAPLRLAGGRTVMEDSEKGFGFPGRRC